MPKLAAKVGGSLVYGTDAPEQRAGMHVYVVFLFDAVDQVREDGADGGFLMRDGGDLVGFDSGVGFLGAFEGFFGMFGWGGGGLGVSSLWFW